MRNPQRASSRLLEKRLKERATSTRKKRAVSGLLAKGKVWSAVRSLYVPNNNNVTARNAVSKYFYPTLPKYNASKNVITRNKRLVNHAIEKALLNGTIVDIVMPFVGKGAKGAGVSQGYIKHAFKYANIKYATIGNRSLRAFALVNNGPNSRYINVIGAIPSYGSSLMNRILKNAKNNGKKYVNLKAVTNVENNKNANNYPLVKWYKSKGFVRSGNLKNSLLPMRSTL